MPPIHLETAEDRAMYGITIRLNCNWAIAKELYEMQRNLNALNTKVFPPAEKGTV